MSLGVERRNLKNMQKKLSLYTASIIHIKSICGSAFWPVTPVLWFLIFGFIIGDIFTSISDPDQINVKSFISATFTF